MIGAGVLGTLTWLAAVSGGCAAAAGRHGPVIATGPRSCVPVGQWVVPESGRLETTREVVERAARARVVLLGESHDRPEDHQWELQMLAAFGASRSRMIVGFEMFPRSSQDALDRWVAGEIDARTFLLESRWDEVWGFPAWLYMPLFDFARMNRVPMLALNVDRRLVAHVAEEGWNSVPVGEREGLGDPAPATPAYVAALRAVYREHAEERGKSADDEDSFARFVEAQLTWDRAFGEALRAAVESHPEALVVGVMGRGHVEHGYGVPHQLAALGLDDVQVLLPWDESRDCSDLAPDLADAVFGIKTFETPGERMQLGVLIEPADGGVRVTHVLPESAAEAAGLRDGDVILEAGGRRLEGPADLRRVVTEQRPGGCLWLDVRRGEETLDVVVRFPNPS